MKKNNWFQVGLSYALGLVVILAGLCWFSVRFVDYISADPQRFEGAKAFGIWLLTFLVGYLFTVWAWNTIRQVAIESWKMYSPRLSPARILRARRNRHQIFD